MSDPPSPFNTLAFVCDNTSDRITRELSQTSKFFNNLFYNFTAPFSFEIFPEDIYTNLLYREHHNLCLY